MCSRDARTKQLRQLLEKVRGRRLPDDLQSGVTDIAKMTFHLMSSRVCFKAEKGKQQNVVNARHLAWMWKGLRVRCTSMKSIDGVIISGGLHVL